MNNKKKFELTSLPVSEQATKTDDESPNIGTLAFEKLPAGHRITLSLRQEIADLKSQASKLTSKLEEKNTELKEIIELMDAELINTIEIKNVELREIMEKSNTVLRDHDRVEVENSKLKRICLGVALFAFIGSVFTIAESAQTNGFQLLKLALPFFTAISAVFAAFLSYGKGKNPKS